MTGLLFAENGVAPVVRAIMDMASNPGQVLNRKGLDHKETAQWLRAFAQGVQYSYNRFGHAMDWLIVCDCFIDNSGKTKKTGLYTPEVTIPA